MNINMLKKYAAPGDFVLLGGNGPLQRLVQYGQKILTSDNKPSLWSHVLLVYDSRLFVESTIKLYSIWRIDNGVQFSRYNDYAHVKRAVLVKPSLSILDRRVITQTAIRLESEGIPYPIVGLFSSLFVYYVLGRLGKKQNHINKHGLYCSAFIQDCYKPVGIDFTKEFGTYNTAPEHLWQWAINRGIERRTL